MFRIQTINKISPLGLALFPKDKYEISGDIQNPHGIIVRSADLNNAEIPASVLAIARAGAGYNNIPVPVCSERGIVVFNTPGGNANAVKELTLAAMLIASRGIVQGINWTASIADKADEVPALVEKEKSNFEGPELRGKTLGVVGLGAIGSMVANDAVVLGMNVISYAPTLSVDNALKLSSGVTRAGTLEELLGKSDYISLHIPLNDATKGLLSAEKLGLVKKGARIINMSRNALVKDKDIIQALDAGNLSAYVTDFPTAELLACKKVICIPHLGASTPDAEDNCAVMAARQLMDYLETGAILNSVNFSKCSLEQRVPFRLIVASRNIPDIAGQITTNLVKSNINVQDIVSLKRDDYGYSIIDTAQQIEKETLDSIGRLDGIIRVRVLEKN